MSAAGRSFSSHHCRWCVPNHVTGERLTELLTIHQPRPAIGEAPDLKKRTARPARRTAQTLRQPRREHAQAT